ncbi:hypothetical protein DFJ73DRAFT_910506 [Zopfochytrium polystomum]|nr:hypothetical protein DFJ73DRAFT_910506 [Zopfochytrium polystomum]
MNIGQSSRAQTIEPTTERAADGEVAPSALTDQQKQRVQRLQHIFRKLHPAFSTVDAAQHFFASSPTKNASSDPELELTRWELVSLAFTAELCVRYEEEFLERGRNLGATGAAWVRYVESGSGGRGGDSSKESDGPPSKLIILPGRRADPATGVWLWTSEGVQSAVTEAAPSEPAALRPSRPPSSRQSRSRPLTPTLPPPPPPPQPRTTRRPSGTSSRADAPEAITTTAPQRRSAHSTSSSLSTTTAPGPSARAPAATAAAASAASRSKKPAAAATPTGATGRGAALPIRCLLVPTDALQCSVDLRMLCEHGEVFAELWRGFVDAIREEQGDVHTDGGGVDSVSIGLGEEGGRWSTVGVAEAVGGVERIHNVLERLTVPPWDARRGKAGGADGPAGVFDIVGVRAVLSRMLALSRPRGEAGPALCEREIARLLFTTDRFGAGRDAWTFSFIIWQCVKKVHGDRLDYII